MSVTCFDRLSLQKLCFRTLRKSYPKSENQEGKKSGKFGSGSLTHAWRARIPTVMLFFCCHKCHTRTKIVEKKAEKFTGESDEKLVFPCYVLCVSRNWIDEILNYVSRVSAKCCNRVFYEKMCDTCDSQNNKTPCNARVRVRARRVIIGIFTILKSPSLVFGSLCSVAPSEGGIKKNLSLLWKQAVVFLKTSCRFCENEPSFLR